MFDVAIATMVVALLVGNTAGLMIELRTARMAREHLEIIALAQRLSADLDRRLGVTTDARAAACPEVRGSDANKNPTGA